MNVLLFFFFTDNNESCESLWNRVCVKEPDGLREEALPQSLPNMQVTHQHTKMSVRYCNLCPNLTADRHK